MQVIVGYGGSRIGRREEMERRRGPRIYDPIMIRAIGIGADGGRYMFETIAEDVGAGGLCALAPRHLEIGGELCFRIRFSLPRSKSLTAPVVLARGTVLRVRGLPQGGCLFAAAFSRRRIL